MQQQVADLGSVDIPQYFRLQELPAFVFRQPEKSAGPFFRSSAAMEIAYSNAACLAGGENADGMEGLGKTKLPVLSPEKISEEYPLFSSSLFNLIQNAEALMGAKKPVK